jgi:hypothetical protein
MYIALGYAFLFFTVLMFLTVLWMAWGHSRDEAKKRTRRNISK